MPTAIVREGEFAIVISWSDGSRTRWTAAELRSRCPCATCREKKRAANDVAAKPVGLPVLSAAEAQPLTITGMRPAGAYAYNIAFSDGHSSGLFQMSLLHEGP
ncbi:MAG: DUF971 domain-containing protein [Planctomycetota bacterium]